MSVNINGPSCEVCPTEGRGQHQQQHQRRDADHQKSVFFPHIEVKKTPTPDVITQCSTHCSTNKSSRPINWSGVKWQFEGHPPATGHTGCCLRHRNVIPGSVVCRSRLEPKSTKFSWCLINWGIVRVSFPFISPNFASSLTRKEREKKRERRKKRWKERWREREKRERER